MKPVPRSFVAVTTSGIYCEPGGCAAQPNAENVRRYPTAAAAEAAGFRACLRCRPYRAPVTVSWTGSALACRAVRMILAGALDGGRRETDLAARLGVSARHLRRLFATHLGVTPAGLARSARTHFARRLLDDTDLPITDVAFAAGFGSLRQFNHACKTVFRAPPRELRARRRSSDPIAADRGLALRLPYRGPLDWNAMLEYLAAYAVPGVEAVRGQTYHRIVVVDGEPGTIELGPGDDHLTLRIRLANWAPLVHVAERARQLANIDLDSSEPVGHLASDSLLGPLVNDDPGLRPPGAWDGFEIGVRAILGPDTAHVDAVERTGRLVERLGAPIGGAAEIGLRRAFPSPQTVAAADPADMGVPARLGRVVVAFARAVAADAIRLDRSVGRDQLVSSVTAVDGVGPQVAHEIAYRIGEPDAWPTACLTHGHDSPVEIPDDVSDRWRPWRAFAAAHVWRAGQRHPRASVESRRSGAAERLDTSRGSHGSITV